LEDNRRIKKSIENEWKKQGGGGGVGFKNLKNIILNKIDTWKIFTVVLYRNITIRK
jgi:hypothetical protein